MARRRIGPYTLALDFTAPADPEQSRMKIKLRNSKQKKARMTGFRTRQKTAGGRKVNKRQRARHGSF